MKKFMAFLCAGILACSMSVMTFAAESPNTTVVQPTVEEKSNSTVEGVRIWNSVIVDGKEVAGAVKVDAAPAATVEAAKAQAAALVSKQATVLEVVEVTFPESFKSITIPFNLKNIVNGQNIVALHQKKDGTWEKIKPDKVENGVVTVTFTSLSPVAFVNVAGGTTGSVKSPKTEDSTAVPFVSVIAIVAVAGAAVAGKKAYN